MIMINGIAVDSMAIMVLLGSFFLIVFLRFLPYFPCCTRDRIWRPSAV